ncbi:hypothetical protein FQR65_LT00895 [Abscondita terminalis]|nr:hypothetical protein FQR65_LT00895 [Abscondita terminalis]
MYGLKIILFVLTGSELYANCARILGIVPTPSYSHQVVFQPIFKELSLRGHQVTTITTNPIKNPALTNLTEIDLHASYDIWNEKIATIIHYNIFKYLISITDLVLEVGHYQFSHPEVQDLIHTTTEQFDIVMVEYSMLPMFVFAKKFKAPLIMMISVDALSNLREIMGSPTHPIVYPDPIFPLQEKSTLSERLLIVLLKLFFSHVFNRYVLHNQQILSDQYFGTNYPPVEDLAQDVSLLLANSDPILHGVKPLVPTIVLFGGGSHRTPPKPLPTNLKNILDQAENGFIYFSLGSNVKKHPNIKLFITQGGLQSLDEAIFDHVPMIGMPFFGDQEFNANKLVKLGFGLYINYRTMSKGELKTAILEVITNPKYKENIVKMATLAQDQPMTGLENAVWWTEYVIRHNGTRHLRSPLLDIPFYQYYLLDVIAVFVLVILCITYFIFLISRLLIKIVLKALFRKKVKLN